MGDLVERGLRAERHLLWGLDGGKGLRKAAGEFFPGGAFPPFARRLPPGPPVQPAFGIRSLRWNS